MRQERRRDNQQWILDQFIRETGRSMLFDHETRSYPPSVKSYRMIPKVMGKIAQHKEDLAKRAEKRGHLETALELYHGAVVTYHDAQHVITQDDNPEKIRLNGRIVECFDRIIEHSSYPIERVEVPWEGVSIQGLFHLQPDRRRGPTILFIPGMDMMKEQYPPPFSNPFHQRGMHLFVMDGPGQGISNLRKIRVSDSNYERAASAVIDYLLTRPEVDPARLGVFGMSMGSFWGIRTAAYDPRVRAVATVAACYGSKVPIFEEASPRFKQVFMYMSGIHDEEEFDAMADRMTCDGYGARIRCPSLMVVSEFDQLCNLEDCVSLYEEMGGPKEFWLLEDESHSTWGIRGLGGMDARALMADWLRDALAGRLSPNLGRFARIAPTQGPGPYADDR